MTKIPKSFWLHNKRILISSAIVLFLVIYVVFGYLSNKPNYKDLNGEYAKLAIPSSWEQINRTNQTGLWGMFCFASDVTCPDIQVSFTSNALFSTGKQTQILTHLLEPAGYRILSSSGCLEKVSLSICQFVGIKGSTKLTTKASSSVGSQIINYWVELEQSNGSDAQP